MRCDVILVNDGGETNKKREKETQDGEKTRQGLLDHLGSQAQQLHPALLPQFTRHNTEHTGAKRLALLVEQHTGVVVEAHVAAVGAHGLLAGAHDQGVADVALLDLGHARSRGHGAGLGLVDDDHDLIACYSIFGFVVVGATLRRDGESDSGSIHEVKS